MFSDSYSQTFGTAKVTPEQRSDGVRKVFSSVASRYDIMNDVMSGGLHRLWKRYFINSLPISSNTKILDLASGTGDIAIKIMKKYHNLPTIKMVDPSAEMLKQADARLINNALIGRGETIVATAEELPFADRQFDLCTISFGLRNVTHLNQVLSEIRRVLVYGGHFFCLEFSPDINPILRQPFATYGKIIPVMGRIIANDYNSYKYLIDSIHAFPTSEVLVEMMRDVGFDNIKVVSLNGGLVRIHSGVRF